MSYHALVDRDHDSILFAWFTVRLSTLKLPQWLIDAPLAPKYDPDGAYPMSLNAIVFPFFYPHSSTIFIIPIPIPITIAYQVPLRWRRFAGGNHRCNRQNRDA